MTNEPDADRPLPQPGPSPGSPPWESPTAPPPGPGWSLPPVGWQSAGQPPPSPGSAPWNAPPTGYWQAPVEYGSSGLAIVSAVVLMVMGVLLGLVGLAILAFAAGGQALIEELDPTMLGAGGAIAAVLMVIAIFVLLIAALHVGAALGVFLHRGWGRWAGITAAVIGLVLGVLMLLGQIDAGLTPVDLAIPVLWLAAYGVAVTGLATGGEHFTTRQPGR